MSNRLFYSNKAGIIYLAKNKKIMKLFNRIQALVKYMRKIKKGYKNLPMIIKLIMLTTCQLVQKSTYSGCQLSTL